MAEPAEEESDLAALCARARSAQRAWGERPVGERIDAVLPLKQRLLSRAAEIAEVIHEEVGKPVEEALLAEVIACADLVDHWCSSIEELLDVEEIELDALSYPAKRGRTIRQARGVIALITPWNYPVAIPLRTLVPALLAGNAVVFKPSEVTPRAGALCAELFAGLPADVLTLLPGGREVGAALAAAEVDAVVFTGSVAAGRSVAHACAERLVPCSLELGGKDAAIVLADCRLERTAQGVAWGAFTNAGQNCAGIERVYVEKSIADEFLERLVEVTRELERGRDFGPLCTEAQAEVVSAHLDDAREGGAVVLTGGTREDEDDLRTLRPTVLRVDDPDEERPFLRDETFGPILPVMTVDSAEEAVERVNASRYALTTSIWTRRIDRAHELGARLRSGVVTINNHALSAAMPAAPWTGAGDSGYGITNSAHALATLTRVRFVLEDRSSGRELWWYSYTPVLRRVALAFAALRGGAGLVGRVAALWQLLLALPRRLWGG